MSLTNNIDIKHILLLSDSHGNTNAVKTILSCYEELVDLVVFCGDGVNDIISICKKPCITVRGNNDWTAQEVPEVEYFYAFNQKFMVTHGHKYFLYTSMNTLLQTAKANDVNVVLFGHLHIFCDRIYFNIRLINPGSCSLPRDSNSPTFAILEQQDNKLICTQHTIQEIQH